MNTNKEQSISDPSSKLTIENPKNVGLIGTILLTLYLIALSLLTIYSMIQFLPDEALTENSKTSSAINYLIWQIRVTPETQLFITVALAGLLGSMVHALRSLYWYVGNRKLVTSWIPKYILMPFAGSALGISFYLIIRGGFFAAGSNVDQTNPYGFIALGVLIGMFSEQAVLKLKEMAETLLSKPKPGEDAKPEE